MKKKISIDNVKSFDVSTDIVVTVRESKNIEIFNKNMIAIYRQNIGEDVQEVYVSEDVIWTNTAQKGEGIMILKDEVLRKPYLIKGVNHDKEIYCRLNQKGTKLSKNEEVLWQLSEKFFVYNVSHERFFYKTTSGQFCALSDNTGELLWQFTLPENKYDWESDGGFGRYFKAEIGNIIGVYGDLVWVSLNSGRLLAIDIQTGGMKHDLMFPNKTEDNTSFSGNAFLYALPTVLDSADGFLFGMRYHYYWEINLNSPDNTYILYDTKSTCLEHGVIYNNLRYHQCLGNEIIFAEQGFAQDPSCVGIFDRATRKIKWTSRQMGRDGIFKGVNKVHYDGEMMYVLDRANTLTILEKDRLSSDVNSNN